MTSARMCPACRRELPDKAQFCGYCGFRMAPLRPEPILLTRKKQKKQKGAPPSAQPAAVEADRRKVLPANRAAGISAEARAAAAGAMDDAVLGPPRKMESVESRPAAAKTDEVKATADFDDDGLPTLRWEHQPGGKVPAPQQPKASSRNPATAAGGALAQREEPPRPATGDGDRREVRLRHPREHAKPRAQRFPMKVEVNYQSEHNFYTGFVENISSGGLFIATHSPLSIGELIEVTFSVPGLDKPCEALCRVCWIREYDAENADMVPGMGCQFGPLEPEVRAAIDAFIRHREPIFFDS